MIRLLIIGVLLYIIFVMSTVILEIETNTRDTYNGIIRNKEKYTDIFKVKTIQNLKMLKRYIEHKNS